METAPDQPAMRCMEVWGGNHIVDQGVAMIGLDAWVYSRPHENASAGGDIHLMSSCATGRIARVLLADVSGHGSQAAGLATDLRRLMRRYVNYVDQERLVRGLNESFGGLTDLGRFATAVVVTFWVPTREIAVSNAGHPRPLHFRAKTGRWSTIEPPATEPTEGLKNIPLGIAAPTRYDERKLRLARGDLILLYTDALIESQDAAGRDLGTDGLVELLSNLDPHEPEEMIGALVRRVHDRASGDLPDDDETVLLLRPNDIRPRVSPLEGLSAGVKVTVGVVRALPRGLRAFPLPEITLPNLLGAFTNRANQRGLESDDPD